MRYAIAGLLAAFQFAAAGRAETTFYRDVLPILQQHCQSCHRPGEIGKMPLLTYEQTRPWAKAIREQVTLRKMPPWFAQTHSVDLANDPSLKLEEIAAIQAWVDRGSPAGSKSDAPPPPHFATLNANLTVAMPKAFPVPAKSTIEYQYFVLNPGFKTDTWVTAVEVRPSDRSIVHHAVVYVRAPGEPWDTSRPITSDILAVYTPGAPSIVCPEGMAKKIPAGSDLVLQMHYTSKSTDASDRTEIRMATTTARPQYRLMTLQMAQYHLHLAPEERNQRVTVSGTLPREALLVSLFPHMHLRGSAFDFQIVRGPGQLETLLRVAPYDFYWQLQYWLKTPMKLAAGTRLLWTGYYDNSKSNPRNPDPDAEVTWGGQSWEEMMVGFFDVAVPPDVTKREFFVR